MLGGGDAPTELRGVAGSPEYAAPEVLSWLEAEADETGEVEGEPYDARCDVWSVGVTAHVLLCVELPFDLPEEATEEALVAAARTVDLSYRRLKGEAKVRRGQVMVRLEGEAAMAPAREFVRACMTVARKERPTAQQLLGHPWIVGPPSAPNTALGHPWIVGPPSAPNTALDHPWIVGQAVAVEVAAVEVVYVFTAEAASDVKEQLGVTLSAGDPLTDQLLATVRDALDVPASMTNDQLNANPSASTLALKPLTALATTALATPASGPSASHARSIQRTYGAPHYCSPRQAP